MGITFVESRVFAIPVPPAALTTKKLVFGAVSSVGCPAASAAQVE
jgi:hypothetical protein